MTPDKDKKDKAPEPEYKAPEPERKAPAKAAPKGENPGAFDTSEAVNITETYDEALEVGYLGVIFDDGDYTVDGVT